MQYQNSDNVTNKPQYSIPKALPLETPFWSFSLSVWKDSHAKAALLELQDKQGLQINHLLFAAWLGMDKREILVDKLIEDPLLSWWHTQTVSTLRDMRKQLNLSAPYHPQLKATVQSAELQAEQIEQALLFDRCKDFSCTTTKRNTLEILAINLLRYTQIGLNGSELSSQGETIKPRLISLVHAAMPNHDRSQIDIHFSRAVDKT